MPRNLEDLAARIGTELPVPVADRLAAMITAGDGDADLMSLLESELPVEISKGHLPAGTTATEGSRATFAVALRAAARAAETIRRTTNVTIAATLPDSSDTLEQSAAALTRVVASVHERLLIVTYATQALTPLADALYRSLDDGVSVRVIAETRADAAGHFWEDARGVYGHLRDHGDITFWRWPHTHRTGNASLHAKAVVADGHTLLVTSANLTENALLHNLEIGVVVRSSPAARQLLDAVERLIAAGQILPDLP